MEVNVFPLAVVPMPNTGLFGAGAARLSFCVDRLHQPVVTDDADILTEHSHMWLNQCRLVRRIRLLQVEIEPVKLHAFDQMTAGFWFERGERDIAQLLVGFPVSAGNAMQQFFRQLN